MSVLQSGQEHIGTVGVSGAAGMGDPAVGAGTGASRVQVEEDLKLVSEMLRALQPVLQDLSERYGVGCQSIADARFWKRFMGFAGSSRLITPSLLTAEAFNEVDPALVQMRRLSKEIRRMHSALSADFSEDIFRIDGETWHEKLTQQFSAGPSRLLSSEYKQMMKELRQCRRDWEKPSYETAVKWTKQLMQYQLRLKEYRRTEKPILQYLGPAYQGVESNWQYLSEQMDELYELLNAQIYWGCIPKTEDLAKEQTVFRAYRERLEGTLSICTEERVQRTAGYFDPSVLDVLYGSAAQVREQLDQYLWAMVQEDAASAVAQANQSAGGQYAAGGWSGPNGLDLNGSEGAAGADGQQAGTAGESENGAVAGANAAAELSESDGLDGAGASGTESDAATQSGRMRCRFQTYRMANLEELRDYYYAGDLQGFVKGILATEAPLSEELLLKRIVWWFGREKVTSAVLNEFSRQMAGCEQQGMHRRHGFLYLDEEQGGPEITLRIAGELHREIRLIAPEELAAGMRVILKLNGPMTREELYEALAEECGGQLSKGVTRHLDSALELLGGQMVTSGDQIALLASER